MALAPERTGLTKENLIREKIKRIPSPYRGCGKTGLSGKGTNRCHSCGEVTRWISWLLINRARCRFSHSCLDKMSSCHCTIL